MKVIIFLSECEITKDVRTLCPVFDLKRKFENFVFSMQDIP